MSRLLPSKTESDLASHFKQFGNLTECFIKKDANGASKNFGFLRFETVFQYNICLKYKSHIICGKEITVEKVRVAEKECTNKLFVRGVINDISKDDLKNYFDTFGEVITAKMSSTMKGQIAFIEFDEADVDLIETIVSIDNHILKGVKLYVEPYNGIKHVQNKQNSLYNRNNMPLSRNNAKGVRNMKTVGNRGRGGRRPLLM